MFVIEAHTHMFDRTFRGVQTADVVIRTYCVSLCECVVYDRDRNTNLFFFNRKKYPNAKWNERFSRAGTRTTKSEGWNCILSPKMGVNSPVCAWSSSSMDGMVMADVEAAQINTVASHRSFRCTIASYLHILNAENKIVFCLRAIICANQLAGGGTAHSAFKYLITLSFAHICSIFIVHFVFLAKCVLLYSLRLRTGIIR